MLGDEVVVIGPMLTPPNFSLSPWVEWMQNRLSNQYEAMENGLWEPTARQFYTGNASIARHHLIDNGGFDPTFFRAEDVELAFRLADRGLRFIFNPKAVGFHCETRSFSSWIDIPYAYGRNDVIFSLQKGQPWLLETVFNEFHERPLLIRGLIHLCLDRPQLSKAVCALAKRMANTGQQFQLSTISHLGCSCIFNLRHYQGVADELGGREKFFSGLAKNLTIATF
jgi:GT2 family glycosyltransferase